MESLASLSDEDALRAVEQAVLERMPEGSREKNLTLTTDNGTQFTSSRFLDTLGQLGITHRRTAYHHPEGNSYIERYRFRAREKLGQIDLSSKSDRCSSLLPVRYSAVQTSSLKLR